MKQTIKKICKYKGVTIGYDSYPNKCSLDMFDLKNCRGRNVCKNYKPRDPIIIYLLKFCMFWAVIIWILVFITK